MTDRDTISNWHDYLLNEHDSELTAAQETYERAMDLYKANPKHVIDELEDRGFDAMSMETEDLLQTYIEYVL